MGEIISARGHTRILSEQARQEGTQTLREAGLERVFDGTTSLEEVLSATEANE
jgi:type IV pilus assembly protein PilB